ncbi:hypothetical protein CCMSSC00406_0003124 [Pleurotus cornucopiae]|uniref:Uncharacterized protein n=1 Tax=Pleurotus cornucopiae TaxID=5321 RepID=A0ACB7J8P1_PLECO|nr:hypothetical protein CCMSSC00406_0003124 [Pleurotus cornucopiae]
MPLSQSEWDDSSQKTPVSLPRFLNEVVFSAFRKCDFSVEDEMIKLYFSNYLPISLEDFLSRAFPGIHIRCLRIFVGGPVLKNYPIEELFISDPSYRSLLDEGPIYPSLRQMTLVNIGLTPKVQTFSRLKRWLKAQSRLEKLTIRGSGAFTARDIQVLEKIVAAVELVPVKHLGRKGEINHLGTASKITSERSTSLRISGLRSHKKPKKANLYTK